MASVIRLKRRATGGASGAPSSLKTTEPAFNEVDNTLYLGFGDDGSGNATSIVPIGGTGAFVDKSSAQSISGVKTYTASPIVPAPTTDYEAATKKYVDDAVATAGQVDSVNGETGVVVLDTDDVSEGSSNKYFTEARAKSAAVANSITNGVTDVAPSQDAVHDALALKLDASEVGTSVASLVDGKVPSTQLPSYVDDVVEAANLAALPGTGETGKIYVALDTGKVYRWSGSIYVEVSPSEVNSVNGSSGVVVLDSDDISEGSTNLYHTAARVLAVALSGLSTATNAAIEATDSILIAMGKLQAQVSARLVAASNLSDLADAGTARTNLGLGSMATQAANNVSITGGSIDGVTLEGGTF